MQNGGNEGSLEKALGPRYCGLLIQAMAEKPIYLIADSQNQMAKMFQHSLEQAGRQVVLSPNHYGSLANCVRRQLQVEGLVVIFNRHPQPKVAPFSHKVSELSTQHWLCWEVTYSEDELAIWFWINGKRVYSREISLERKNLENLIGEFNFASVA